ncbi:hypothetical protein H6758_03515 [Candidatus Nomurabacteria bacterium]|nr:hypothetical protein [Candidatus Nomurabacteria bacterium]
MSHELNDYIRHQRQAGAKDEQIKKSLLDAGWSPELVNASLGENLNDGQAHTVAPAPHTEKTLPDPWQLLLEAWESYKLGFWKYIGLFLIAGVIFVLLGALLMFIAMIPGNLTAAVIIPEFIVFMIAVYVLGALVNGSAAFLMESDGKATYKEIFAKSWTKVGSLIWIVLIVSLITFGALIPLIIPFIFVATFTTFALFVVVFEDERGINAVLKSREYVRGIFGPVLGRVAMLLVYGLILGIIASIFEQVGGTLGELLSALIQLALSPLFMLYSYKLYRHVRAYKADMQFLPSPGGRKAYIALAIWGIIGPLFLFMSVGWTIIRFISMANGGGLY